MLVSMKKLLDDAKAGGYGVAAPNVFNLETVRACFEAADELKAPIIIDGAESMGLENIAFITKHYAGLYPQVEAALNLDHGRNFPAAIRAIRCGYTSVMVDRSTLPFEENIKEVREIVKICHAIDVSVEAELGHVGMGEEYETTRNAGLTKPEQAAEFVERTGIDMLAVAIGTSHGTYKGTPYLDFPLLEEIKKVVSIPLVLHGGSGTGDENLQKAVRMGIQKVNLFTDLSNAGLAATGEVVHNGNRIETVSFETGEKTSSPVDLRVLTNIGADGYKAKLKHYMKLFGSEGRTK